MNKMKANKKAEGDILHVILFISILIVLIFFAGKAKQIMEEKSTENICKSDVDFVSLKNAAGESGFESKMRCEPNYVTIRAKDPEEIQHELASNMLKCWTKFGEGKANLFSNKRRTMENYCIICSYISFKNKGIKIDNFLNYLMTHKPNDSPHPQGTYFERLYGSVPSSDMMEFSETHNSVINTNNDYATLFTYAKKVGNWDKISGTTAGAGGGFTIGAGTGMVLVSVLGLSNPVGWIALGAFGGMSALGVFSAVKAPWNPEKEWTAGIFLIPFQDKNIINLACTKLGS